MVLPSDRLALAAAILTCHAVGRKPTVVRIKNTLRLGEFWASEALEDAVRQDPALEIVEVAQPMAFDTEGNLQDLSRELAAAGVAPSQQDDAW